VKPDKNSSRHLTRLADAAIKLSDARHLAWQLFIIEIHGQHHDIGDSARKSIMDFPAVINDNDRVPAQRAGSGDRFGPKIL
jgi:hypothetical protein